MKRHKPSGHRLAAGRKPFGLAVRDCSRHLTLIRDLVFAWLVSIGMMILATPVWGQSVCLPLPRLLTTMPMGGTVGSQFDIVVTGENIEENHQLLFNHPGIVAELKKGSDGQLLPNQYVVKIASDCPPGLYEARLVSRLGISSARIFSVDRFPELVETVPNTTLATAMELPVNAIVNAVASPKAVDHFQFQARKGQRYFVYCASRGIDSKLDPVVIMADDQGRDLLVERLGNVIDFTAQQDGKHVIKIHELTFRGGQGFFYRLFLQEADRDASLPAFPSTRPVHSFSWLPEEKGLPEEKESAAAADRKEALALQASIREVESADDASFQKMALPCDLSGSFYPAADVDRFEFEAKKGEEWWIEVASERLGRPTDPSLVIQRVVSNEGKTSQVDVLELTDIPPPMKPSSNGYAYDGPPYDGGSSDILGRFEVPEDGLYRLQLTDLFGGTRNDPRNVYRMIIRKAAPDFALASWGLHMELRNGDRNALSKPLALRCGSTVALEVVVVRRDGFQGDIQLMMDQLPDGVTAHGLKIPAGKSRGVVLLTAHQDAPRGLTHARFYGMSSIQGQMVRRKVQMAQMAWPVPDAWGEIPSPRLVDGIPVSVTPAEFAPISLASKTPIVEAKVGQKVTVPLVHTRRSEFSGNTLQLRAFGEGFEQMPRFDVAIDAGQSDVVIDLAAMKTTPGEYLLAFYGAAVAKYQHHGQTTTQDTVDIVVTEPITLRVQPMESP